MKRSTHVPVTPLRWRAGTVAKHVEKVGPHLLVSSVAAPRCAATEPPSFECALVAEHAGLHCWESR